MESENESVSQESSSNTFSFRKLGDVFNNMEIRGDDFDAELRDEINVEMNKKVKRFMSTPIPSE